MRVLQILSGLAFAVVGFLLLAFTTGWVQMTLGDLIGVALALSGLFFWIPGIIFRQRFPALTFLFIPGTLAFAIGGILIYTARVGIAAISFLWVILVVAVGIALLAVYWLGIRAPWLRLAGLVVSGVGILLFALFAAAWATEPAVRLIAPILLVAFGLFFAIGSLVPKRQM